MVSPFDFFDFLDFVDFLEDADKVDEIEEVENHRTRMSDPLSFSAVTLPPRFFSAKPAGSLTLPGPT